MTFLDQSEIRTIIFVTELKFSQVGTGDRDVRQIKTQGKIIFRLVTSVGQRKILNPNEESNLRPSHSALRCSTTESQRHVFQIDNIRDLFKETKFVLRTQSALSLE